MVDTPSAGGVTQPGRALSERMRVADQIEREFARALERFLAEVEAQGRRELDGSGPGALVAAGTDLTLWEPWGEMEPYRPSGAITGPMRVTLGTVTEAWRWAASDAIAALIVARGVDSASSAAYAIARRVVTVELARGVYDSLRAVMTAGRNEGWSLARTQRELAEALEPESQHTGEGLTFTAVLDTEGTSWATEANAIARTEAARSYNGAALDRIKGMDEDGMHKRWVAHHDARTRSTHRDADGQTVPVDEQFSVGGDLLDYPGDPLGSTRETINCRCGLVAVPLTEEGDVPKPPTKSGMYQGAFGGYNAPN